MSKAMEIDQIFEEALQRKKNGGVPLEVFVSDGVSSIGEGAA
jgi:hypothetical protein